MMVALTDLCGCVTSHLGDSPLLRTEMDEVRNNFFREILNRKVWRALTPKFSGSWQMSKSQSQNDARQLEH